MPGFVQLPQIASFMSLFLTFSEPSTFHQGIFRFNIWKIMGQYSLYIQEETGKLIFLNLFIIKQKQTKYISSRILHSTLQFVAKTNWISSNNTLQRSVKTILLKKSYYSYHEFINDIFEWQLCLVPVPLFICSLNDKFRLASVRWKSFTSVRKIFNRKQLHLWKIVQSIELLINGKQLLL